MGKDVVPKTYEHIESVEIRLRDGSVLFLNGEQARSWVNTVEWGLRSAYAQQLKQSGRISEDFTWKVRKDD